jgi:hypothetical protein
LQREVRKGRDGQRGSVEVSVSRIPIFPTHLICGSAASLRFSCFFIILISIECWRAAYSYRRRYRGGAPTNRGPGAPAPPAPLRAGAGCDSRREHKPLIWAAQLECSLTIHIRFPSDASSLEQKMVRSQHELWYLPSSSG